MIHLESIVRDFLEDEEFSLKNALAYATLGLGKAAGQAGEIASGVGFSEHPYSRDRQIRMAEIIGESLFYLQVLATTTDISLDEIVAQYISAFEATRIKKRHDKRISIQDLMDMKNFVKAGASAQRTAELAVDSEKKRKWREQ